MKNIILDVMLGHAVGDALGVLVEFLSREKLNENPVTTMLGYGTHNMPAGTWSDDTSMSLATLQSLKNGKLDYNDIMENFGKWYYDSEFTATGELFDVGNTCGMAIRYYTRFGKSIDECGIATTNSNGNGSLMRIHPFVLYAKYMGLTSNLSEFLTMIHRASALTHRHIRSQIGCGIYAIILSNLLENPDKAVVKKSLNMAKVIYGGQAEFEAYSRLVGKNFDKLKRKKIKSSGYIVDSLEASLWCLLTTDSYRECVLKAVNLGGDTDTIGAIAGGLAGAMYGKEKIPQDWLEILKRKDYIYSMCNMAEQNWKHL